MYNGSKEQPHTVHCSELRKRSKCDIYIREMGAAVCIVTCSKKNTIVVGVFFCVAALWKLESSGKQPSRDEKKIRDVVFFRCTLLGHQSLQIGLEHR